MMPSKYSVNHFLDEVLVYLDPDFIVVNKPAGLLSVPGRGSHLADCLLSRLVQAMPEVLLVHRLDRDTSGIMVFARHKQAQAAISKQFEQRQTTKYYQALVHGELLGQGEINIPVRYDTLNPPYHIVDAHDSKVAITHWKHVETLTVSYTTGDIMASRIDLFPVTGRSHQLRVHLQYLEHPIIGDTLYAKTLENPAYTRLCLHATALSFLHPTHGSLQKFEMAPTF